MIDVGDIYNVQMSSKLFFGSGADEIPYR